MFEGLRESIFEWEDIEKKLLLAIFYGKLMWSNNSGNYFDNEIEEHIFNCLNKEIGKIHSLNLNQQEFAVTLIVSELYPLGGHTRIVVDWLRLMSPFYRHRLIVTRAIPEAIESEIKSFGVDVFRCRFSGKKKIEEIVSYGRGSNFIVLHIHPDDIVAAVASRIFSKLGKKIVFYNHADHAFSFGIGSADIVCEISKFGMELNKKSKRVKGEHCWLGIPVKGENDREASSFRKKFFLLKEKPEKILLSCGNPWKYRPFGQISFDNFLDALLSRRSDIKVVMVGPTGKEGWWHKTKAKWKHKVDFKGFLPYNEYYDLLKKADVYVDSFPVTGGTAFSEALLHSVPGVGLKLGVEGYSCADFLRVRDIGSAIERVEAILNSEERIFNLMNDTFAKLEKFNSIEAFKNRLFKLYSMDLGNLKNIPCAGEICWNFFDLFISQNKKIEFPLPVSLSRLNFWYRLKTFKKFWPVRKNISTRSIVKFIIVVFLGEKYKWLARLKKILTV